MRVGAVNKHKQYQVWSLPLKLHSISLYDRRVAKHQGIRGHFSGVGLAVLVLPFPPSSLNQVLVKHRHMDTRQHAQSLGFRSTAR